MNDFQFLIDFFNWIIKNWERLLTLVGIFLTVYFSRKARKSSDDAKDAVIKIRSKLETIDNFNDISQLIALTDELHLLLGQKDWPSINDRAKRLRYGCGDLTRLKNINWHDDLFSDVQKLGKNFKDIADAADRAIDPDKTDPDINRYRRVVVEARTTLTSLSNSVRRSLGNRA